MVGAGDVAVIVPVRVRIVVWFGMWHVERRPARASPGGVVRGWNEVGAYVHGVVGSRSWRRLAGSGLDGGVLWRRLVRRGGRESGREEVEEWGV